MKQKTKYYGIVEGFFSKPLPMWSQKERQMSIEFISKYAPGINTYLYCPKDDCYITQSPYKLYSNNLLCEIKEMINLCISKNIKYIYGLNPTLEPSDLIDINKTADKILNKFKQIYNVGCRNFCLLFDDIPIAYDVFDSNIKINNNISSKIIELVNIVYKKQSKQINSFWFCSPDYCFNQESTLTKAIQSIDKNINIFWSGNEIFSTNINKTDISRVENLTKNQNIALWSNYPVNDAEQNIGCFNLGGFYLPTNAGSKKLVAIFANPMREAYANFPFYITYSNFIKNQYIYNRKSAWKYAINTLETNKTYNKLYLNAINQVIFDKKNKTDLFNLLTNNKKISFEYFNGIDRFPTNTNIVRYFPEIYNIVISRQNIYQKTKSQVLKKYKNTVDWYQTKYIGKQSLNINGQDKQLLRKSIDNVIKYEQKTFLKYLNNNNNSIKSKRKMYNIRWKTNRFTICNKI